MSNRKPSRISGPGMKREIYNWALENGLDQEVTLNTKELIEEWVGKYVEAVDCLTSEERERAYRRLCMEYGAYGSKKTYRERQADRKFSLGGFYGGTEE